MTRTYKLTGSIITAARRLRGIRLRVTGTESLPDQPTVYLVNHFTRLETFLMPYVIYHARDVMVHTLAHDGIFKGILNRYWPKVGVHSVKMPRRNRTIIGELMRGTYDWVIYPEGGLIKNKKLVRGKRLHLEHPKRSGPPRTGGAVLAIRAELAKQAVRDAAAAGQTDRLDVYQEMFQAGDAAELAAADTVIVPVSITYHDLKSGANIFTKLARLINRGPLNPRTEEELQIEGNILLGRSEINVHFGEPINVRQFIEERKRLLTGADELATAGRVSHRSLRKAAETLTQQAMRSLYSRMEISLDHLASYGLRAVRDDVVDVDRFRQSLYLAAMKLRGDETLRLHPVLTNGIRALATGSTMPPLEEVMARAEREGVVHRENGHYHILREAQAEAIGFHEVRMKRITRVVANELEPIRPATVAIERAVNLRPDRLSKLVSTMLREQDARDYADARSRWASGSGVHAKPVSYGSPIFLPVRNAMWGVVLVHGYRANPEQMRDLAHALHARGMSVYGVRLAGHGTSPANLIDVQWSQWLANVMNGLAIMEQHGARLAVGGLSLGGLLSLLAAAQYRHVDAVFSVNAPLRLRDRRARLVPALVKANAALRKVGLRQTFARRDSQSETPEISYDVDYLRGVREVRRTIAAARRSLADVSAPALVVQALEDPTAAPSSGRAILDLLGSAEKQLISPDMNRHGIVRGPGSPGIHAHVIEFLERLSAGPL